MKPVHETRNKWYTRETCLACCCTRRRTLENVATERAHGFPPSSFPLASVSANSSQWRHRTRRHNCARKRLTHTRGKTRSQRPGLFREYGRGVYDYGKRGGGEGIQAVLKGKSTIGLRSKHLLHLQELFNDVLHKEINYLFKMVGLYKL